MKHVRPILTQHRIQRLILWTLALLHWIAAVLFAKHSANARHMRQRGDVSLAQLSNWVAALIMTRALHFVRARPQRKRFHYWRATFNARPTGFNRSILGARLRRLLKHKDAATHIAQLIAILRDLDWHAARFAFRMRHRASRLLRAMLAIAPATRVFGAPAPPPALADSS